MADAFFRQIDADRYEPTELARGPWSPEHLHGGPPCALLGCAVEALDGPPDAQVARITFEILRPVPAAPVRVRARAERPGRRVQLASGVLLDADGDVLVQATAWRLRREPAAVEVPEIARAGAAPIAPDEARAEPFFDFGYRGYHDAVDLRVADGSMTEPGPATVWLRQRVPLVAGDEISPLTRVLVAADSGNGVSGAVDYREVLYVNTDLSVHLHREPVGEWVALDARTTLEAHGVGLADAALSDVRGRIGRSLQTLFVGPHAS